MIIHIKPYEFKPYLPALTNAAKFGKIVVENKDKIILRKKI